MLNTYCTSPFLLPNAESFTPLRTFHRIIVGGIERQLNETLLERASYEGFAPFYHSLKKKYTYEDLSDSYTFNPLTGETFPLFNVVGCGKCPLCRDIKTAEWSFRCECETATSLTSPLFVTLTYNNESLPDYNSLKKKDVQDFLKRLRINALRNSTPLNLRYIAVGEYGSRTKRPHYHLILWNTWQGATLASTLDAISHAWGHGFCYVKPCDSGATTYVLKYMRKEWIAPAWFPGEKPFFLSSRRGGGIGSAYARSVAPFHRKHPEITEMSVTNPFSGKTIYKPIPGAFRDIFYPTPSRILSSDITKSYKTLRGLLAEVDQLHRVNHSLYPSLDLMQYTHLFRKYSFLDHSQAVVAPAFYNTAFGDSPLFRNTLSELYEALVNNINALTDVLSYYSFDRGHVLSCRKMRRINALTARIKKLDKPLIDVKESLYSVINRAKLSASRELF